MREMKLKLSKNQVYYKFEITSQQRVCQKERKEAKVNFEMKTRSRKLRANHRSWLEKSNYWRQYLICITQDSTADRQGLNQLRQPIKDCIYNIIQVKLL